jgi:hypothetical protein
MVLLDLECLVVGKFRNKLKLWSDLLSWRCTEFDSGKLNKTPFCTFCNFMKIEGRDYFEIKKEIKDFDTIMESIFTEYVENAIQEISNNIGNLDIIEIPANHKKIIKSIAEDNYLPEKLDRALIASINQLFKNFKIIDVTSEQVLTALFKKDHLHTLEQIQKNYFEWENEIKKSSGNAEIRIKLN